MAGNQPKKGQNEAETRPVIGGQGPDQARQADLDKTVGLSEAVKQAKKDLAAGHATEADVWKAAGIDRK